MVVAEVVKGGSEGGLHGEAGEFPGHGLVARAEHLLERLSELSGHSAVDDEVDDVVEDGQQLGHVHHQDGVPEAVPVVGFEELEDHERRFRGNQTDHYGDEHDGGAPLLFVCDVGVAGGGGG